MSKNVLKIHTHKKNKGCTSWWFLALNTEFLKHDAAKTFKNPSILPCQFLQSGAVQAAWGRARLHPDGLRRHHQERLWRRGLHVAQHSARWKEIGSKMVLLTTHMSSRFHNIFEKGSTHKGGRLQVWSRAPPLLKTSTGWSLFTFHLCSRKGEVSLGST